MKITGFKVARRTDADLVRNMCIKHQYYTHGDKKAYEFLLELANNAACDDELIQLLAEDIYRHSDIQGEMEKYGVSEAEIAQNIIFNLYTEATYTVVTDTTIKL